MTAMQVAERMTAEEFLSLPQGEATRWLELIEGEVVLSAPTRPHAAVQQELIFAFENWRRAAGGRGTVWLPLDVLMDERNVYQPDLLWYAERREVGPEEEWPSPLPDLAAEIRSPSTWRYDVGAKKSSYERHGLPELWLVDTKAMQVLVFRRSQPSAPTFDVALELDGGDVLASPQLPGFGLALARLFAAGA